MRRLGILCLPFLVACGAQQSASVAYKPRAPLSTAHQGIINGTVDGSSDPSVIELMYIESNGAATCTGELVGPHSVMTAGHCTDLTAGGELSGQGGPALNLCTTSTQINSMLQNGSASGCNLLVLALFNNTCTTNSVNETCETNLINAGNYIVVDQLVNPGYNSNSSGNDNDIGLAHLNSTTLQSGHAVPGPILTFNRASLGSTCTDLGSLTFMGFGIGHRSQGNGQVTGMRYKTTHDIKVHDQWHTEEDGRALRSGAPPAATAPAVNPPAAATRAAQRSTRRA